MIEWSASAQRSEKGLFSGSFHDRRELAAVVWFTAKSGAVTSG